MAQWEYMTLTLAGGDELYTALWSVEIGTFGGHWKQELEQTSKTFVGGYERTANDRRRAPEIDLYPFYMSETDPHSVHDKYESLWCVLGQKRQWISAVTNDAWGTALMSGSLPVEFVVTGVSESIDREHTNAKVTLNLKLANRES